MASEIARRGHPFPPKSPPSNRGNRDRASRPDSARTSPEATGWRRGRKWGDSESGNPRFPPRDAGRRPLLMKIEQRSNAGNARFDFRSLTVLRQDKLRYNSLSLSLSLSLSAIFILCRHARSDYRLAYAHRHRRPFATRDERGARAKDDETK